MKSKILFAIALALLWGCQGASKDEKPKILVTIAPYATFAERIVGDFADVIVLVPPGSSPHTFEPSPKKTADAANNSVWFRTEEPFEIRVLSALLSHNPSMTVIDLQKGLPLIQMCCHEEGFDTHTWLSLRLAQEQVRRMSHALIALFPDQQALFAQHADQLIEEMAHLDDDISASLKDIPIKTILVSHPAFGYFCRDYGLEQLSIEGEGKEPSPRQLNELMTSVKQNHIHCVFVEKQYSQKGAQLIADKLHLQIHETNPYSYDYFDELFSLAQMIKECNTP